MKGFNYPLMGPSCIPYGLSLEGRSFTEGVSEPTRGNTPLSTWWRGHEMPGSQVRGQEAGPQVSPWQAPCPLCISGCSVPKERAGFPGQPSNPPQNLQLLMLLSPQLQNDNNYYHYYPLNVKTPY